MGTCGYLGKGGKGCVYERTKVDDVDKAVATRICFQSV